MSNNHVAAVVGVGPGLGAAVAQRFAKEGFAVGLLARSESNLQPVQAAIEQAGGRALSIPTDASDAASMNAAFSQLKQKFGDPEVLVYNAGAFKMGGIMELSPAQFEDCFKTNCLGGFLAAQCVLPAMIARRHGTVIFTGATASLRGSARFSGLAVGKFGLRALAQSMARELGPQGLHIAHVIIDGQIDTPRLRGMSPGRDPASVLAPTAIAETYFHLYRQDPSAWTHELELRPATEKW